jgi:hypothetical protein
LTADVYQHFLSSPGNSLSKNTRSTGDNDILISNDESDDESDIDRNEEEEDEIDDDLHSDENDGSTDDEEILVGKSVSDWLLSAWNKRCHKLISDFSITGWMFSPIPEIMKDVNRRQSHLAQ